MEAAITTVLAAAGDGWKPNKVRKKTFAKLGATDATWTDFKDCLKRLVKAGTVLEVGDRVRLSDAPTRAPPPAAAAPAKRKAPAIDEDAAEKRQKKDAAVARKAERAGGCTAELSIPAGFVAVLLRQSSTKLKNIETNSKTHVQISRDGATLTISGETEARLKTAEVLLGGMLKAFDRRARDQAPDKAAVDAGERRRHRRDQRDGDEGGRAAGRGRGGRGGGRGRGGGKGRVRGRAPPRGAAHSS
jgi:hypothetical protein